MLDNIVSYDKLYKFYFYVCNVTYRMRHVAYVACRHGQGMAHAACRVESRLTAAAERASVSVCRQAAGGGARPAGGGQAASPLK